MEKDRDIHLAEVRNLSVAFQGPAGLTPAVRNVSWHVDRGETLAILGESGSGKSVSASAFMGLIDSPPGYVTGGELLFNGERLDTMPRDQRQKFYGRRIAMIFQDPLAALNPVYSVGWQVAETFAIHGVSRSEAQLRAIALLERVGIQDARRRQSDYPHQFSGGQRQRIMIAMSIAMNPDLLIADEPTTALDVTVQAQILDLLKELQSEYRMGLLLITHDIAVVAGMADRVVVMKNGEVVETGATADIISRPQHPYTRKLIDALPGLHPVTPDPEIENNELLLRVRNLSKHYALPRPLLSLAGYRSGRPAAMFKAMDDVSFDLRKGEALGIVGESGSGKTTLAGTLLGLRKADAGTAEFRGRSMLDLAGPELMALRRRVQVVFQDPTASLNPLMTVEEIIAEPWRIHPDVLPKSRWHARVGELLEHVGMQPDHARRYPHQFSGGQRQRIAIARALALNPELIICDEAVSALDVSVQAKIIRLLKNLQKEFGLSYIFIAHDLPVVRDFADRVMVMYKGKVVEIGSTQDLFSNPQHAYTRELLAASHLQDDLLLRTLSSSTTP